VVLLQHPCGSIVGVLWFVATHHEIAKTSQDHRDLHPFLGVSYQFGNWCLKWAIKPTGAVYLIFLRYNTGNSNFSDDYKIKKTRYPEKFNAGWCQFWVWSNRFGPPIGSKISLIWSLCGFYHKRAFCNMLTMICNMLAMWVHCDLSQICREFAAHHKRITI